MQQKRLTELFQIYDEKTQQVLRDVLLLEQQYITRPLRTNSTAWRELRDKIDEAIEKAVQT
jgi:hypothetical protein